MSILNQEDLLPFYRKNSYEEKFADNAKWIELCVDSIDKNMGYSDIAYHTKLDVNYSIIKNKSGSAVYQDLIKNGKVYKSPLVFYLKNGFEIIENERLELEKISAVKVRWINNS